MVFASVPVYLDPHNWNQPQQSFPIPAAGGGAGGGEVAPLIHGLATVTRPSDAAGMAASAAPGTAGRPISMSERARLAKIPQPEQPLNCPRCDSTNTKFCYYNNYSLSQPRHFCKTCRRYWTRGGALRNVPVGGGCRRNKRSKPSGASSSKSSTTTQTSAASASSGAITSPHAVFPSQLSFMAASLHPLPPDFNFGASFPGLDAADYQLGGSSAGGVVGLESLRLQQMQQFPLLGGGALEQLPPSQPLPLQSNSGQYPYGGGEASGFAGGLFTGQAPMLKQSALISQLASVKMEDNQQLLNFPRNYLGVSRSDQFWNGGDGGSSGGAACGWDISGFNSSSG